MKYKSCDKDILLGDIQHVNPHTYLCVLQRYCISMDFVQKFERQCGSQASVKRLHAHPSYQTFQNKWNLPVYFQLRWVMPLLLVDFCYICYISLLLRVMLLIIETSLNIYITNLSNWILFAKYLIQYLGETWWISQAVMIVFYI